MDRIWVDGQRMSLAEFETLDKTGVKSIDASDCTSLTSLTLPNATEVYARACTSLTSLTLPNATKVDARACTSLTSLTLPNATKVYASDCTSLTSLTLPNATEVDARACTSLTSLTLPNATKVYARACTSLTSLTLPNATEVYARADLFEILKSAPDEVGGVLKALTDGKVNGTCYEGACACLVGTIANIRGVHHMRLNGIRPDSSRPAERWFLSIGEGDTPENNIFARLAARWIEEFIAEHAKPTA